MKYEVRHEAFHDAVPREASLLPIATGFTFTEGPIWDGSSLFFSDIAESKQWVWREGEGARVARAPSGQANGNCLDTDGRIVSCEHATSTVTRHEHGGKVVRAIATRYEGRRLNSPNDIVCDARGRLYFTDPTYGRTREDLGILREPELDHRGLYRLDPPEENEGEGSLTLLADDFDQPNGLCFDVTGTKLLVNDSPRFHIRIFDFDDGRVSGGDVWADVTGDGSEVPGSAKWVPDGMKTDTEGRIWVNGPGGVHVFDAEARDLGVILMPEKSTNFCFGGAEMSDLFITASTSVYRLRTLATGVSLP